MLLRCHGRTLIELAARSIRHGLARSKALGVEPSAFHPDLRKPGAVFVTLKRAGRLRGCVGSLQAWLPLVADVAENAFRAGFRDRRFAPLGPGELPGLDLSISHLSRPEPIHIRSEQELLAHLRPGVDGLIIRDGQAQAVFLPVVWETLPEPRTFLGHLKKKAGLKPDHWSDRFQGWRFTTHNIAAGEVTDPAALWITSGSRAGA